MVAVELFRQDKVTLSRAAEIAGVDRWSFMDALRAMGVEIVVEPTPVEEMDATIAAYDRLLEAWSGALNNAPLGHEVG